ncbi:O-antigen ligase family protein [Pseudobdellovibrio exovorus]|uniref:O-antigen ligase-related domain-containing protein n=1 Tax=Pseudobdellovibrio exovorus JSS TaxID=1184267 RepID=M4V8Y3_9BACT|nr:O-antigen ligase family protein [Pseudobdellovibrio exovorus]AGH95678.1 hypothetical protein A11Q_1462 [Pseudobdellovibrio exovorus JSS]
MFEFLVGLATLGGVTSQTLMDTSFILIFLCFIFSAWKSKSVQPHFKPTGIEWAFLGYVFVVIVSLIINGKEPVPWLFYLSKFNWIINFYLLIYAFSKINVNYERWINFFSIAFLLPNIYAIVIYFLGYDLITQKVIHGTVGLVNSATYHAHGNSLIFMFFVTIYLLNFEKIHKRTKISGAITLCIMGISIFLTYTRGIWGALFISLLILSYIKNKKLCLLYIISTTIILSIGLLTSETLYLRVVNSFSSDSDQMRSQLLQVHWLMFKDHPWFGIGYWESYRQIADYWPRIGLPADHFESHSHNQYLNVLATTGITGFIFFMSILVFFLRKSVSFMSKTFNDQLYPLACACFLVLIQFLLACLTDVTFEYSKIRMLVVITFAMLISFSQQKRQDQI